MTFWAVSGKVSYFSTLETGIRLVVCGGGVSLEIVLWAVSLISVGVLLSPEVVASIIPSVVPSSWCPVPVDVHWDRGIVHPLWCVGRVVLGRILPLGSGVVPLWMLLLGSECSKGSISSEYIP